MNLEQISLIDVAPEPLPEEQPKAQTIYLVAAYHKERKAWKIMRETHDHEYICWDHAVRAALKFSAYWSHAKILKVEL